MSSHGRRTDLGRGGGVYPRQVVKPCFSLYDFEKPCYFSLYFRMGLCLSRIKFDLNTTR